MAPTSASDVFIPGGLPQATYVAREHLGIEQRVSDWASGAHTSLLSVSGPTKTGKTVLLKRFFRDAVWFSGGAIETADEFWQAVADELEVYVELGLSVSGTREKGGGFEVGANAGFASMGGSSNVAAASERGVTRGRTRPVKVAAREALQAAKEIVIIDDFHYIPQAEQVKIIRGLKDLIFEGVPFILVAVPHRAYDAVRVEKEMTGRVENIALGQWDEDDLRKIPVLGFAALSKNISEAITDQLVAESFGSPHLMQTHCLALAQASDDGTTVVEPDWDSFFRARAAAASKTAFDLLKQGPRQRNDRNIRRLKDGLETDIYGAVLAAVASTGPRTSLQYEDLRTALRNVMESDLPQRHEVTNILEQMTKISREKIPGEPVLEYDNEYSTLYIADPFFAYYLRWAPESMKELAISRPQD
ncbi:hypothetical protein [Rhodococcoides kroppenstedtii]|uniref:hypothetical protein n=1 Tax=Rhodococcoides kroppenstedtii TaxID=293050 RepID=UPI001BDE47DA|nr:hypothetical protein [Rhodococcus kroppenstedtii]MBT1191959.1 hypothetical protein [Rhodococcus kroppenstedtii]